MTRPITALAGLGRGCNSLPPLLAGNTNPEQRIPPIHSIIIPHRDRLARLILCIWSIERSAHICGITDYEIIVSDQHSSMGAASILAALNYVARDMARIRVLGDADPVPTAETPTGVIEVFSKTKAINIGIEASQGDVLTFLDADAVVGRRWMEQAAWLSQGWWADTTRLCYRVRIVPKEIGDCVPGPRSGETIDELFERYDEYPRAHEGYASPEINASGCVDPYLTFGNSQFSIRKSTLGSVRCDERFKGSGYEDLTFIADIWKQAGSRYKGIIRTEAEHAMFHVWNTRGPWWYNSHLTDVNRALFTEKLKNPCRELVALPTLSFKEA